MSTIFGKKHKLTAPDFFIEKKNHRKMAKFNKLENPMLKRKKSFVLDFANTMTFAAILIYCVSSIGFGLYVLNFIHKNADLLFKVAEFDE